LDVGCNIGNVTFGIAQQFAPRVIIGNDIDNALIKIAKTNAQIYAYQTVSSASSSGGQFPLSFAVTNGPIAAPILLSNDKGQEKLEFPRNVIFKQVRVILLKDITGNLKKALHFYRQCGKPVFLVFKAVLIKYL
jgi:7SK snRNA methylphosphate capping enzyme